MPGQAAEHFYRVLYFDWFDKTFGILFILFYVLDTNGLRLMKSRRPFFI